jgi:hypothetical protein
MGFIIARDVKKRKKGIKKDKDGTRGIKRGGIVYAFPFFSFFFCPSPCFSFHLEFKPFLG